MCLLFFESKETTEPNEYKLVLANVRDEFYSRPTKEADFWHEHPSVIGGRDLVDLPGRTGGTWLAMNQATGKLGILLNILQPEAELAANKHKKGRGFIVNDYVTGDESHEEYTRRLSRTADEYNGFLFIALQLTRNGVDGSYFSTHFESEQPPKPIWPGLHAFGNSLNVLAPWPKVSHGKKRFESILSGHPTTDTKSQLVADLFDMLGDKTLLPLDNQMLIQGNGREIENLERLSSIFVEIPATKYGSRTWTVVVIDGEGSVNYIERTMKEPIHCDSFGVKPDWQLTNHSFLLGK